MARLSFSLSLLLVLLSACSTTTAPTESFVSSVSLSSPVSDGSAQLKTFAFDSAAKFIQVPTSGTLFSSEVRVATYANKKLFFIAEQGCATLDFNSERVSNTPLNDLLQAFNVSLRALIECSAQAYDSVAHVVNISDEDRNIALLTLVKNARQKRLELARPLLSAHPHDALGQYVFWRAIIQDSSLPTDELDALINSADPNLLAFPPTCIAVRRHRNALQTSVGRPLADLSLRPTPDSLTSLSHLVWPHHLTLLHVFDPYNPHTPADFNTLDALHNAFPSLNIISLCQFANSDITHRLSQKFSPSWFIINDSAAVTTHVYGLSQLPTFFIIKDSTIVERNIASNALMHWFLAEKNELRTK